MSDVSEVPAEYVKVETLKPGIRNLSVTVKVSNIGSTRTVFSARDRSEHRVTEALVGDETGSVLLTLWDDQIEAFKPDDVIEIKNGYTSLFRRSLRLNIGRYGTAEKVDKEIAEINTENNLSEKTYTETRWSRPSRRPFGRYQRRY